MTAISVTIFAVANTTGLGVFTVTLYFGDGSPGSYQYSKHFSVQIVEQ